MLPVSQNCAIVIKICHRPKTAALLENCGNIMLRNFKISSFREIIKKIFSNIQIFITLSSSALVELAAVLQTRTGKTNPGNIGNYTPTLDVMTCVEHATPPILT